MLFLSYAKEDEGAAAIVATALRARGYMIYDWQDPERQAGRFIKEIEGAIQHADAYVALVSPHFMASPWCQRERELALQRELDLQAADQANRVFIYVLKIASGRYTSAGFMRGYAWLDLTSGDEAATLDILAARLGPIGREEPMKGVTGTGARLAAPLFRNRRQELDRVYIWAVHDIEDWSSRPAAIRTRIQQALRRLEAHALVHAGLDPARVGRRSAGDGAVLAVPGDFPKEVISTKYVDALCEGIEEHDAECGPGESIRLRLALHAGEMPAEDDELAGPGVVTASSLVDSAVLCRVLAAAKGSALALVVSDEWYSAVVKEGNAPAEGYQEVWIEAKQFADWAWVRVPGRTQPPGLLPGDRRPRPGSGGPGTSSASQQAAGAGASVSNYGTIGAFGDFRGATIDGNVSFGNNYHGTHGPGHNGGPQQDGGPR